MIPTVGLIILLVVILVVAGTAAWAGWRAAPFVPTKMTDVRRLLKLAEVKPGELVLDLGAGDGRIVAIAAREFAARAIGYEISFLPLMVARIRLWLTTRGQLASISARDFYHVDLSLADVVVCFLTPGAMRRLAPKFQKELKPGARVVSYAFQIPDWTPVVKDKPNPGTFAIWVYKVAEH